MLIRDCDSQRTINNLKHGGLMFRKLLLATAKSPAMLKLVLFLVARHRNCLSAAMLCENKSSTRLRTRPGRYVTCCCRRKGTTLLQSLCA